MRMPTAEQAAQAFADDQSTLVRRTLPRLDWHDLWGTEEEEEYLVYPLIAARRLVALFSPAKVGKSLLMLELAAGLSAGREVLGRKSDRRIRVLYIDFENDPRGDVRVRLEDMGYGPDDLDHLDYLSFPTMAYLDQPQGARELMMAVEEYGSELVVIDTISRAVQGEENDNDTWLNFYKHTGLALKQAQVALIRLDHTGKDETKGQRGGSAKAGDVDAIWKLTTVVADERFRLECVNARFRLETKELTLIRHDDPLHHTVEVSTQGSDREAKILHAIQTADQNGVDIDWGRDRLKQWATGFASLQGKGGLRNDAWSEVVRRRKTSHSLAFDPNENLSPSESHAQGDKPVPDLSPTTNGKTHNPLSDLSPTNGDRFGTGPMPDLSPLVPPYKGDRGQGQDPKLNPDQPCKRCGRALGVLLVHRGLDAHVACQREIDREEAIKVRGE